MSIFLPDLFSSANTMETVGDRSVHLVCQWWFCINIGRVRNRIHTVKYDSSTSSLQFHGSCCGVKFSFYTLCRRSTWIMHWAREISCFKSYMHLPRFCLYYQDELQMEKCLMGYGLTSLFSIQLWTAFAALRRKQIYFLSAL